MRYLIRVVATFAFTGFFPIAPATVASAAFVLLYALVPGGEVLAHPVVLALTLAVAIPAATYMEREYGEDPSCVVIDEVVGMQVALSLATGVGWLGLLATFLLFRLFDIAKPFPIYRSQRLPGGWGIVVDDFLAGVYTRVVLIGVSALWPALGHFGV